jgi:hypothetical protein
LQANAAHASSSAPNWGCTKHSHDRTADLSSLNEEGSPYAETNGDIYGTGADADAYLCVDSTNNGWYWAVRVRDTLNDSRCAHAGLHWRKSTGAEDIDYGMWVCATVGNFYTPTRNGTRYQYMYLTSFADGQAETGSSWYWVPDLV